MTRVLVHPASTSKGAGPKALLRQVRQHSHLIVQFTKREIESRYRGSILGLVWSFVNPLVLLLLYTFVFGVIFRARWPSPGRESLTEYALVLFCGLIAFSLFSECVTRAPGLIVSVPHYVRRVVFPVEILPLSVLGSALFQASASLGALVLVALVVRGTVPWTLPLLPLVLLPLVLLSLGATWFLASLGVFVRDVGHVVGLVLQVLLFATPILYPLEAVPEGLRVVLAWNPLTSIVENLRRVVLWGTLPAWGPWAGWSAASAVAMLLGHAWFMKTKRAFADVI